VEHKLTVVYRNVVDRSTQAPSPCTSPLQLAISFFVSDNAFFSIASDHSNSNGDGASSSNSIPGWAIAMIVLVAVLVLVALGAIGFIIYRRRRTPYRAIYSPLDDGYKQYEFPLTGEGKD